MSPVSPKIRDMLKLQETKPPLVNNQCVAYVLNYDLGDADYIIVNKRIWL